MTEATRQVVKQREHRGVFWTESIPHYRMPALIAVDLSPARLTAEGKKVNKSFKIKEACPPWELKKLNTQVYNTSIFTSKGKDFIISSVVNNLQLTFP